MLVAAPTLLGGNRILLTGAVLLAQAAKGWPLVEGILSNPSAELLNFCSFSLVNELIVH